MFRGQHNLDEDHSRSGSAEDPLADASMDITSQVPSAVLNETMSSTAEGMNVAKQKSSSWETESSSMSSVNNTSTTSKSWSTISSLSSSQSSDSSSDFITESSHSSLTQETSYSSIIYNEFLKSLENVPSDRRTSLEPMRNRISTSKYSSFSEYQSSTDTSFVYESSTEEEPNFSSLEYTTASNSNGYGHSNEDSPETSLYRSGIQLSDETSLPNVESEPANSLTSIDVAVSPNLNTDSYSNDRYLVEKDNERNSNEIEYEESVPSSTLDEDMSQNGIETEQVQNNR